MESDATLAGAAASGDRDAFNLLYRRYHPGLLGFVIRQVGDHHLAEDIVQESFLVAWRDLDKLREASAFRTWLFSIAYKRSMSHVTTPAPVPLTEAADVADFAPGPEAVAEQHEAQALVWDAAVGLEPRQRAVLELAVRWELSSKEIGDVLGVNRAHASVLVHRARSALGTAVKAMLVARQRGRCRGLDRLAGHGERLTSRQRSSVDHHLRRCPDCARMKQRVAPRAVLGLLFPLAAQQKPWALTLGGGTALKVGAVALVITAGAGTYALAAGDEEKPAPQPQAITAPSPQPSIVPSPSPSASPKPSVKPSPTKLTPELEMLKIINQERAKAGCKSVRFDDRLAKAAELHSADMGRRKYFDHITPDGVTPWDRAKRQGYMTPSAENIAAGNETAAATMRQFMNSPGHKANILNCSHKAVGVGRTTGGPYRYYWTQLFGSR